MKPPFLISLSACLLAISLGNAALASDRQTDDIPILTAASGTVPAPLAARFDLQIDGHRTDWYLWRDKDSIETANVGTRRGEIWERQGDDSYGYSRIFHNERKVVEYTPGELKARNAAPDWEQLGSVISLRQLAQLKRLGSKAMFGQKAVHYRGRLGSEKVDVWWLNRSRLPALLHRTAGDRRISLRLKELEATSPSTWPNAKASQIAAYGRIDAADFGDMETDPFVARVLSEDGHHHHHQGD